MMRSPAKGGRPSNRPPVFVRRPSSSASFLSCPPVARANITARIYFPIGSSARLDSVNLGVRLRRSLRNNNDNET